ncbi:DNA repair protein RecO [Pseudoruegeria sp. SHC-113]|uniref:DNA repair protein RecO n=1 Tax=Pseudoruegeria sp. SHC-113 TaxID=2855439 RepID=UPI0021BAB595|nr:DNA repair protein RecO [Pseudoruegeria sp. SHC-113]MCT8158834.1 DNA repair protein RecO [Pseudoruegeria sp. SHC-113]
MEWREEGVLIAVRRHGESAAIIEVFTESHGRHAGVVRGGASRKIAPVLQPGAQLDLTWRARLEDHIGAFTVEPRRSRAGLLSERAPLAGLNALCAMLAFALPEREPHPRLYAQTQTVLDLLGESDLWPYAYLQWELALLRALGFPLSLDACAVTGAQTGLIYVSPKTGRAVSAEGAGDWADRLLPLPAFLAEGRPPEAGEIAQGFALSGFFLTSRIAEGLAGKPLPPARRRLLDLLARQSASAR